MSGMALMSTHARLHGEVAFCCLSMLPQCSCCTYPLPVHIDLMTMTDAVSDIQGSSFDEPAKRRCTSLRQP